MGSGWGGETREGLRGRGEWGEKDGRGRREGLREGRRKDSLKDRETRGERRYRKPDQNHSFFSKSTLFCHSSYQVLLEGP